MKERPLAGVALNWTLAALLASLAAIPRVGEAAEPGELRTSLTLYLWLPSMEGDLKYDLGEESGSIDAGALLDALEMAFMAAFEARKGKWSALADVIYLDFGQDDRGRVDLPGGGSIETDIDLGLGGWQVGLYGGYQVYRTPDARLDLLAGARYLALDADATLDIDGPLPTGLPSAKLSRSTSIWDAVAGFRGRVNLDPNWFLPYQADVGTGDSELTWQAMAGLGYQADWGDAMLIYRHLEWDEGEEGLLQGLSFTGPAIALRYNF